MLNYEGLPGCLLAKKEEVIEGTRNMTKMKEGKGKREDVFSEK